MEKVEKIALLLGLIASVITLLGFFTGVFTFNELIGSVPGKVTLPKANAGIQGAAIPTEAERIQILFKLTLMLAAPLLPGALFWRLACSQYWNLDHEWLTRIVLVITYAFFVTILLALFFPTLGVSRIIWQFLAAG